MRDFQSFDVEAYRRRLRLLRLLFGENQIEFSARLDLPFKKWNHYERGYALPKETAFIIYEKIPGMDPMWIWFGLKGNLSASMRKRIEYLESELAKGPDQPPALSNGKSKAKTKVKAKTKPLRGTMTLSLETRSMKEKRRS